jgi:hypothetical protein
MGYCRLTWSQMAKWQRLRQFQDFIEFLRTTVDIVGQARFIERTLGLAV